MAETPVGIEVLEGNRKNKIRVRAGIDGRKGREWILDAGGAVGIRELYSEELDGRAEGRVLDEVVVELHERLNEKHSCAAAQNGGVRTGVDGISDADSGREVAEVVMHAARRETGISIE